MNKFKNSKIQKYLINVLIIWIIIGAFTSKTNAAPEKKEVLVLLEGRHWRLDSNNFYELGVGTDIILIKIASDTNIINYLRFRALEALALYPTERTAIFLEKTIKNSFAPLARRGFESFILAFRKTHPKTVERLTSLMLKHPNPNIRISAARTIRSINKYKFTNFLKLESNSWVRKEAQK